MKKITLFVFCLIASCTIGYAQTYWHASHPGNGFYNLMGYITIDGEESFSESLEIGSFNEDGTCVGADWYPWEEEGHLLYFGTFYGNVGDVVSFKLYDHESGEILDLNCEVTATLTEDKGCIGCNWPDEELFIFAFTTPAAEPHHLTIEGYGDNEGGYHLIASPVTEPITPSVENGFLTESGTNYDLYYFDQQGDSDGNEWINYNPNQFTIQSTKGYLYASKAGTTLEFAGTDYNGDGIVPLEYYETNQSQNMWGWNLIGNPFPQDATIDLACYKMNGEGTELEPFDGGATVEAMNGVFVKATGTNQSAEFSTTSGNGSHAKVVLNVMQNRGANIDRAIVSLNGNSSLPKFMLNPENTKIYIPQGGEDYAVVSSTDNELPVSFKAKENGTYTLKVAVENTEMYYLHLIDHIAGNDVDLLANPSYTFEANSGDFANRFTLVMSNTEGVDEHFAYYNGIGWTISNTGQATLQVIDMTGRIVNNTAIDGVTQLDINAAPGVYMLRLVNGNDVKVQKVVVR